MLDAIILEFALELVAADEIIFGWSA